MTKPTDFTIGDQVRFQENAKALVWTVIHVFGTTVELRSARSGVTRVAWKAAVHHIQR